MLSTTEMQIQITQDSRKVYRAAGVTGHPGPREPPTEREEISLCLIFEYRAQFLSFFIVAAARQKSYIMLKQVKRAYQHFRGGHSGAGPQRKQNTYIH